VRKIAKTELTIELEKKIWEETNKQGIFGCFEVTIGWYGNERVDYMTYDTKGIWRCYEIKVSKSDFHSKAKKTFIGHYNYFVMPKELYEEIKEEIPSHVGVYCGNYLVKRPKKQELGVKDQILKDSMIRSLSRENEKFIKTCDSDYINKLKNKTIKLEKEARNNNNKAIRSSNAIFEICEKYNLNRQEVRELVRNIY
jgi:hypothetical protein